MPPIGRPPEWHVVAKSGPLARIGHTLCATDDGKKVYLVGGIATLDEASQYLGDFWEYTFETKEWARIELKDNILTPRAFHSAVWWNGRVVIFGGCNGGGRFNRTFFVFPDGRYLVPYTSNISPPSTRYCHSAVVYNDHMYIYGGKSGGRNSNQRLEDLYAYQLNARSTEGKIGWQRCVEAGDKPEGRSAHSAAVYRDTMIILGGRNASCKCCEDVCVYDFRSTLWRRYPTSLPLFRRARHTCAAYKGYLIIFGGWNGRDKLNDLIFFHIETGTMRQIEQRYPSDRECAVTVMCGDTMVMFGGRHKGEIFLETLEVRFCCPNTMDSILDYLQEHRGLLLKSEDIKTAPLRLQNAIVQRHSVE